MTQGCSAFSLIFHGSYGTHLLSKKLDHPEITECIHDGLLLFGRADGCAAIFGLRFIITFANVEATFLLHLSNVQGRYL